MSIALNGNNGYLSLDEINVSGFMTEVDLQPSNDVQEVTSGFGTTHKQFAPGLNDTKAKVSIAYHVGRVNEYVQKLQPGREVWMVYGPEGALAGKPKHSQNFIVSDVSGPKVTVNKEMVVFEMDLQAADAPIEDLYKGAVFA